MGKRMAKVLTGMMKKVNGQAVCFGNPFTANGLKFAGKMEPDVLEVLLCHAQHIG